MPVAAGPGRGSPPPPGVDMTIDTNVFVAIADLTDAPIPVQLNW